MVDWIQKIAFTDAVGNKISVSESSLRDYYYMKSGACRT